MPAVSEELRPPASEVVACKPAQLGKDELGPMKTAGRERFGVSVGQLLPLSTSIPDQLPGASVQVVADGLALSLQSEPPPALLLGAAGVGNVAQVPGRTVEPQRSVAFQTSRRRAAANGERLPWRDGSADTHTSTAAPRGVREHIYEQRGITRWHDPLHKMECPFTPDSL